MSSYLTPEDGPFVFGAYASLFGQSEPLEPVDVTSDLSASLAEDVEDVTVSQIAG